MEETQQLQTLPEPDKRPKKHGGLFIAGVLIGTLSFLGLATLGTLYLLGIIQITTDANKQTAANPSIVCGIQDIQAYNNTLKANITSEQDVNTLNSAVADFAAKVEKKPRFDTDPTCLFIAYSGAYRAQQNDKANTYLTKIEALSERNVFIDSRIDGIQSVQEMRMSLDARTQAPSSSDLTGTSG